MCWVQQLFGSSLYLTRPVRNTDFDPPKEAQRTWNPWAPALLQAGAWQTLHALLLSSQRALWGSACYPILLGSCCLSGLTLLVGWIGVSVVYWRNLEIGARSRERQHCEQWCGCPVAGAAFSQKMRKCGEIFKYLNRPEDFGQRQHARGGKDTDFRHPLAGSWAPWD